ncbi:hypothetical protein VaNZ11_012557 [Volvox africanus]|uniref:Uncharacterized protein n=1 Tax=Volvox africanus TaxID=51714 RepID=A0ABQ5SFI4_9CHLO|nr:hypothetical protein VaNZ11_012557 [Volvox africanus]
MELELCRQVHFSRSRLQSDALRPQSCGVAAGAPWRGQVWPSFYHAFIATVLVIHVLPTHQHNIKVQKHPVSISRGLCGFQLLQPPFPAILGPAGIVNGEIVDSRHHCSGGNNCQAPRGRATEVES